MQKNYSNSAVPAFDRQGVIDFDTEYTDELDEAEEALSEVEGDNSYTEIIW